MRSRLTKPTGVGSQFNKELRVGDVVVSSGNTFVVSSQSNTSCTVERDPTTGSNFWFVRQI